MKISADGIVAWRLNRLTGAVEICSLKSVQLLGYGCQPLPQMTQEEADQGIAERYLASHPEEVERYLAPTAIPSPTR